MRRAAKSLVSVSAEFKEQNAASLNALRRAWRSRDLVVFLGAGVSIPYGLPSWQNLVLELLFEQSLNTSRLGGLWAHYRRAVTSWMTDYFSYDPLVLARVVERSLKTKEPGNPAGGESARSHRFLQSLRKHLYATLRNPKYPTLLRAVVDLARRKGSTGGIESFITFNFDDLLEMELTAKKVAYSTISGPQRQAGDGLRVIHAHGFVPRTGPLARADLIFTEPDYHRLTESVFHWSLSEIVHSLRKSTVLFVGLSMSDPSLRRLLDASRNTNSPPHFHLQKRHEIHDHEILEAMSQVEGRARNYARTLGSGQDEIKRPAQLEDALRDVLRQADAYDQEVFESMGVNTIWVDNFDEMPAVLNLISLKA